ncbi:CHAT domain-containing tetratricopeptide repeat protein [Nonomuraea sp. NPDC023979]|uniref:CHAT domain-containing protein n=1 Tax=Nonomuraea sp. NPDC023979 TaxID=3154796 RepID=UPI0033C9858E
MNDPAWALASRIAAFDRDADPGPVRDETALAEAEQAMLACDGGPADAVTWRLIGMLHLARYRLDPGEGAEAAVAGVFFAAVAVVDPRGLPERLRGPGAADTPETWAKLVEELFRHVDPGAHPHVALLLHTLVRRALAEPTPEVCDRLAQVLLQEADGAWASRALALLGDGLTRLHRATGRPEALDDAVHVLFRAALGDPRHLGALAAALGRAMPGDDELTRAHLTAAWRPDGPERSQALLALLELAGRRAAQSAHDADLLAFIRTGQAALDFWHEPRAAHPRVLAAYASGLVEWYAVTGDERSLEAAREMLAALGEPPGDIPAELGRDPIARLDLLAGRRWRRYRATGHPADLDTALHALRHAATRAYPGHPDRPRLLANLANALTHHATPEPALRGPSGLLGEDATTATGPGGAPASGRQTGTPDGAAAAGGRGDVGSRGAAPERAARPYGGGATPVGPPHGQDALGVVGGQRDARADEAITAAREAVAACSGADPMRPRALLLLARALRLDPGLPAADEAVTALRQVIDAGEEPAEAYALLSLMLRRRALAGQGRQDLDDAVQAARQAAETAAKTLPDQPAVPAPLAEALLLRFDVLGDPADLAEALTVPATALDPALHAHLARTLARLPEHPSPLATAGPEPAEAAARLALDVDDDLTRALLPLAGRPGPAPAEEPDALATRLLGIAGLFADRGRHRIAAELLVGAERAFTDAGAPAGAARARSLIGRCHEELGEWEAALRSYEQAAITYRDLGDAHAEAAETGRMGAAASGGNDPARAAALHLRAADLCRQAGLAEAEASQQEQAAAAHLAAGDPEAALERSSRARELYLALGESVRAARVLIVSARCGAELGHLPAAAEVITTCAAELETHGSWDDACQALDAHARLLHALGHAGHAAACETAIVEIVRRRGNRRDPADEWYRIARRRRARGDLPAARQAFERAERAYNAIGHQDGLAAVRHQLGTLAYAEGDPDQAAQDLATAADAYARLGAPSREAAARTLRGACLGDLNRPDDARTELARAFELAASEGDLEALFSATLAQADLALHPASASPGTPSRPQAEAGRPSRAAAELAAGFGNEPGAAFGDRGGAGDGWLAEVRRGLAAKASDSAGARGAWAVAAGELLESALGMAAGDPVREAIVQDRLAVLAARTGDADGEIEALERAAAGLRHTGRPGAFAAVRLGFALEARGALVRARSALEEGLAALADDPAPQPAEPSYGHRAPTEGTACSGDGPAGAEAPYWLMAGQVEVAVLVRVAELQLALGERARGRAALARAVAGLRREGDPAEAPAEWLRIEEAEAAADLAGVLAPARQALQVNDDPGRRSRLLAKLAELALEAEEPAVAHDYAAQGCELGDARLVEHLRNLGAAALAQGRAAKAVDHLTKAAQLAREPVRATPAAGTASTAGSAGAALPVRLVRVLAVLGAALVEARRLAEAGAVLAEGLALTGGPAWRVPRAELLVARSRLRLVQGEPGEAVTGCLEALVLGEAAGDDRLVGAACDGLAEAYRELGETARARSFGARAVEVDRARGRRRAVVLGLIRQATLQAQGYGLGAGGPEAVAGLEEALGLARRIGFAAGEGLALGRLAALDVRAGEHARARQRASEAIALLRGTGQEEALGRAYQDRAVASERLGDLAAALADAEAAGELSERAGDGVAGALRDRAVELAVRLGRGRTAWAHAERAKARLLAVQLGPVGRADGPGPGWHDEGVVAEAVEAMAGVLGTAEATGAIRATGAAEAAGARRGAGVTGVLGFYLSGGRVLVLAHRTGWAQPRAFGTRVGTELLAAAGGEGRWGDDWALLGDLLLGDALDALGDALDMLYLVPYGELDRLPLHALAPGGRLLLERCPVAYAPSLAMLGGLARRQAARGRRSLVVGYAQDAVARVAYENEAAEIARDGGQGAHTGPDATAALLEGDWDRIHLACHGSYDGEDPFGSGVRLGDGLLTARRIAGMRIGAGLVVLGSCESGGAAVLGQALLRAGAGAAVAPMWPVGGEVRRAVTRRLHARIRDGAGRAQALREVTLEARDRHGATRPDLWAAYVLMGLAA